MLAIDQLSQTLAEIAMQAAAMKMRQAGVKASDVTVIDRVMVELRSRIPATLEQALADARQALEAGMGAVAEQTARASFAAMGVQAAAAALEA